HARAVQRAGFIFMDDAEGVSAMQLSQGTAEGAEQVRFLLVVVGQQVGDYFGVSFRGEGIAELDESFAQLVVIFDDAVVDDGQAFGQVRVGVVFGGLAVRGPAGVGD